MRLRKSSGLIMDLRMDEGSGSVAGDYSRYGNDGALNGCKWVENGLEFNGVSDYVDCGYSTQDVLVNPIGTTANIFNVGSFDESSLWYTGIIDDVRIHNRALTPTEIKRDYDSTKHNYI